MASFTLGTIGTAIGGPVGGWIGSAIGSIIDAYLFAPTPADIVGPKLDDLGVTPANPGDPLILVRGADRVFGAIIDTGGLIETKHTEKVSGGKGGGGGQTQTTYTYHADLDILACEGPILGIGRIWADGNILRGTAEQLDATIEDNIRNVAGFPYPDRYRDVVYDAALVPWSLDPNDTVTNNGKRYTLNGDKITFTEILLAAVQGELDNGNVVYWFDTASSYYLPLSISHSYVKGGSGSHAPTARTWDDYYNLFDAVNDYSQRGLFRYTASDAFTLYRGTEDQPADPFIATVLGHDVPAYRGLAHVVIDRLELADFGQRIPRISFEVIQADNVQLKTFMVELMARAEITSDYYDVTALSDTSSDERIIGYSVARATNFRAVIEPLIDIYDVQVAEVGNKLVFRKKDDTVDYLIDFNDMGATEVDAEPRAPFSLVRRNEMELPRQLTVRFKDVDREYQQNIVTYGRQQTRSVQKSTTSLNSVLAPSTVKGYTRDKLQSLWIERTGINFSLPPSYIYLAPMHLIQFAGENKEYTARIVSVNRGQHGLIEVEAVERPPAVFSLLPGETDIGNLFDTLYGGHINGPGLAEYTSMFLMDIPALSPAQDSFGYYSTLSGVSNNWRGAVVYRSTNGEASYDSLFAKNIGGILGEVLSGPLLNRPAEVFDTDSVVRVQIYDTNRTLQSITVDELTNGGNVCLLGTEIVQYLNATFVSTGVYDLEGAFVRGVLGTDDAATLSGHIVGERFAVLADAEILAVDDAIYSIDEVLPYKAVTNGDDLASTASVNFTNTGNRLRPFAPTHLGATRDGSNNATIVWTRRDRFYTHMRDGVGQVMSESIEQYEIDIYDNINTNVKRTVVVDALQEYVYSAVDQTTDGYTPGDNVFVTIYQMSAIVGRGKPQSAEV